MNTPVGIFDSGLGGLTVLKEIMAQLPGESTVYFGDTARVPYGPKSPETIIRFTAENIRLLLTHGVKAIVIACNTASSVSLLMMRSQFKIPIMGVIEPGAQAAVKLTHNGRVGVIGTEATIASHSYENFIKNINAGIKVFSQACPLFVPLVEEGWLEKDVTYAVAQEYLTPLKEQAIDVLVLGCTHYPLLLPAIRKVMGEEVIIVDSAGATALQLKRMLQEYQLLNAYSDRIYHKFLVSDQPEKFLKIGKMFLGSEIGMVERVDIEEYAPIPGRECEHPTPGIIVR